MRRSSTSTGSASGGQTELGWNLDAYAAPGRGLRLPRDRRSTATTSAQIDARLRRGRATPDRPTVILAKTHKGKGVLRGRGQGGLARRRRSSRTRRCARSTSSAASATIQRRGAEPEHRPLRRSSREQRQARPLPTYELGEKVRDPQGIRRRPGRARRAARGRRRSTARSGNSTHADVFKKASPSASSRCSSPSSSWSPRRWACRSAATSRSPRPSRAFFARAYDFVRMPAISQANIRLVGSHAGVEIGADGPSQMALEDLALMRARPRLDRALPR